MKKQMNLFKLKGSYIGALCGLILGVIIISVPLIQGAEIDLFGIWTIITGVVGGIALGFIVGGILNLILKEK